MGFSLFALVPGYASVAASGVDSPAALDAIRDRVSLAAARWRGEGAGIG